MKAKMPELVVVRLGHRIFRDVRTTTHCALVSRVFGAKEIVITGECEESLEKTVLDMNQAFGGDMKVHFTGEKVGKVIKDLQKKGFCVVHLTMYGELFDEKMVEKLKVKDKVAVVIGAEKVPREVYEMADYNVSVGSQPHSEVAALGIVLYELNQRTFPVLKKGKKTIIPQARGKRVQNTTV